MVIYEVPAEKYDTFKKNLNKQIYRDPFDVLYNCDLKVNEETFRLRFQVCAHRQLNPIQAIRLHRNMEKCELITDPVTLTSLMGVAAALYGADR